MTTSKRRRRNRSILPWGCLFAILATMGLAFAIYLMVPYLAESALGPRSERLNSLQSFHYSALMLWYDGLVTTPVDSTAGPMPFKIEQGDDATIVAAHLEQQGIIRSADAFIAYLVYSGLDTGLQAGEFQLSPAMPPPQIAQALQDATPTQVKFVVLPGWRLEEIAAAMPTSGLDITPEQFVDAAQHPSANFDFLPAGASAEGFMLPGEYILPRTLHADQLVAQLMNNTALALTGKLRAGFNRQKLNVYQAVTLASIIQREAVNPEEQPMMASVFLNRLAAGMRLETDPTIQYALGYNAALNTWWKVPLSAEDMAINSPYNTYQVDGLPPGPISNPSVSALQAVANPAQTPYYYFRARCDGSGLHNFSQTFEQHLQNNCP